MRRPPGLRGVLRSGAADIPSRERRGSAVVWTDGRWRRAGWLQQGGEAVEEMGQDDGMSECWNVGTVGFGHELDDLAARMAEEAVKR